MNWDAEYRGARFYKCALQVNACEYGPQYRGKAQIPEQEYNEQILAQCQRHGIEVLGIADHGWTQGTEALRQFLSDSGIVVFPGFELPSSEKIHMVCLYPEDTASEKISQYYGQLKGSSVSDGNGNTPSSLSCEEIAKTVREQHGFWYAAHMTGKNGLLKLSGSGDNYVHLWKKHELVVAGQIPSLEDNLPEKYMHIINNTNLDYRREKPIAAINAKDVSAPEDLEDAAASCLIKMTEPTFEAFRQAFFDPESRIRLNDQTPEHPHSAIKAIQWKGAGFFEDDRLVFSENLNAVIGGRGTGKSTLIESIRYALNLDVQQDREKALNAIRKRNLSNSEISLTVHSKAQHGQTYVITRRYGEQPVVRNAEGEKSNLEPHDILPEIKVLGQNEILDIRDDEEAKLALIRYFFSPENERADREIGDLRIRLERNRRKMLEAKEAFEELQTQISKEPSLKEKAKRYEELGLSDKLKNVQKLEKENSSVGRMEDQFAHIDEWLTDYKEIFDLSFLKRLDELDSSNKKLMMEMKQILDALKTSMDKHAQSMETDLAHSRSQYSAKKSEWDKACAALRSELQEAMAKLPDQMGTSGPKLGTEYQSVLRELAGLDGIRARYQRQEQILQMQ